MRIDFNEKESVTVPGMNHGTGMMTAKMYADALGKVISCAIHPGGSIGMHCHETSDDINYVISGKGIAVTDGAEEHCLPESVISAKKVRRTASQIPAQRIWCC